MITVSEVMGNQPAPRTDQLFGVEIEVENCSSTRWITDTSWDCVEDGSLRNAGREFITPPVDINILNLMVRKFYTEFHNLGYQDTIRTGIHVHVDMRWRTIEQVAAICAVYAVLEPMMFEMCGPDREECIYCVPWYRAPDDVDLLKELMSIEDWHHVHHRLDSTCKYSALYLEPLRRLGTIEFRAAPTFINARDMMRWANTINKIVTLGTHYGTPERVVQQAEEDVKQIVGYVMPHIDTEYAENIIEECDSIGVAHRLVRTRSTPSWTHNLDEPLSRSGIYYRYAHMRHENDLMPSAEQPDEFEAIYDDDDDEQEDF